MQTGRVKKWNDQKGFGFVQPENSTEEIFFHISALQRSARRPDVDDQLLFNVVVDEKGRRKAVDVSIDGVKSAFAERGSGKADFSRRQRKSSRAQAGRPRRYAPRNTGRRSSFGLGAIVLMVVMAVVFGMDRLHKRNALAEASMPSSGRPAIETPVVSQFNCEGKTRCSQMTSCAEAVFYLNNCPGSVTDGDGDGRPCEDQWCGH